MFVSIKDASKKYKIDWGEFIDEALDRNIKFYVKVKKGTVFSFIKECVGRPNRIGYSAGGYKIPGLRLSNEGMYMPVKHENVVALELDEQLVSEVRHGIELHATVFSGGLEYTKDGALEGVYTIKRNYIPGAREFFHDGFFSDDSLEKIKQGGVCKERGKEEVLGSSRLVSVIKDSGPIKPEERGGLCLISGLYRDWIKTKGFYLYLSRPRPLINYGLGVYEGEAFSIKGDYIFVNNPNRIEISSDRIFVIEQDICGLDVKKNNKTVIGKEVSDGPLLRIYESPGYEESYKIARQWICESAGVEDKDLGNAAPLVDLATVAVMVWKDVRGGEKPDDQQCERLVQAMNKKYESYLGHFIRIIKQDFRPAVRSEENKTSNLIGKGKNDWERTGVAALIKIWKEKVHKFSGTVRKMKYREWTHSVTADLGRHGIKAYMSNAVISVILSDQDKENLMK